MEVFMNKKWIAALLAAAMIIPTASCGKKETSSEGTTTETESISSKVEPSESKSSSTSDTEVTDPTSAPDPGLSEFAFTKDNYPVIDGSTSTRPMAAAITSVMLGITREEADEMLDFHKTSASFEFLMKGSADMLICAQPADSIIEELERKNFKYAMEPFAAEALVFVVNTNNPVDSLTTEQIQKIYTGEIKNWKEVGGEDKEIVAVQRNETAGSQVMMEKLVMKDLKMMEAPKELMPLDMGGLIDVVKSFDNSAGAIGYTPYYYATNMKMADGLKILKVDDTMPESSTIASGAYPFCTNYFVVLPDRAAQDDPARILFQWILGEEGQKLAEMEGYVPAAQPVDTKVKVATDWTKYQPANAMDAVYKRISDDFIPDFVASPDYERVFPMPGVVKIGFYNESEVDFGFVDMSGRIVCDPVFHTVERIDSEHYLVSKISGGNKFKEDYSYGILSVDGKYYTGLKFDQVNYSDDNFTLLLSKSTAEGSDVYKFNTKTSELSEPVSYKYDRSLLSDYDDPSWVRILADRYLYFVDDYGDSFCIFDGTTGEMLPFPKDLTIFNCFGNCVMVESSARDGSHYLCDFTGKKLRDQDYWTSEYLSTGNYLLTYRDFSGVDLVDKDGKIIRSIESKPENMGASLVADKLIILKRDAIDVYDLDLNLEKTVKLEDANNYQKVYDEHDFYWNLDAADCDLDPIVSKCSGGKTYLMNLQSEKTAVIDGSYSAIELPGFVQLTMTTKKEEYKWKILDSRTFEEICSGEGYTTWIKDQKNGNFYLVVGEGYQTHTISIIDAKTGEIIFKDLPNPGGDLLTVQEIYDGKLCYIMEHDYSNQHMEAPSSATILDKDGNVIFHYNAVAIVDD